MSEIIGVMVGAFFFITSLLWTVTDSPSQVRAKIIKEQGFCIEHKESGVDLKKCYTLSELK